jgi:hypothetical protein
MTTTKFIKQLSPFLVLPLIIGNIIKFSDSLTFVASSFLWGMISTVIINAVRSYNNANKHISIHNYIVEFIFVTVGWVFMTFGASF